MRIIFLGTNGWYDTKETGSTICTLIETQEFYIILDAGNGIYKADRYIKRDKPVYLFISHFHIDHIEGLHILTKFKFKSLTIYGQKGTKKALKAFLNKKFSVPIENLPYPAKVLEFKPGWNKKPFDFQALKLVHASSCYGFRFKIEGKSLAYCIDTGLCNNAITLGKNADLLISECAFESGHADPKWPHLNPELAAKLGKKAGAKKQVLTHFDAYAYPALKQREKAQKIAKSIFNKCSIAKDNLEIIL
ncbi:MAG: ribonuclease Z [Candidatus Saganbacteria bacterium]|nr:ribonuclease Z [Candidatus Saganbacteria bacterium]